MVVVPAVSTRAPPLDEDDDDACSALAPTTRTSRAGAAKEQGIPPPVGVDRPNLPTLATRLQANKSASEIIEGGGGGDQKSERRGSTAGVEGAACFSFNRNPPRG